MTAIFLPADAMCVTPASQSHSGLGKWLKTKACGSRTCKPNSAELSPVNCSYSET